MSKKATINYYFRGNVECGNGNGYEWRRGYSENAPDGSITFPWMTLRECVADAKLRSCSAQLISDSEPPFGKLEVSEQEGGAR